MNKFHHARSISTNNEAKRVKQLKIIQGVTETIWPDVTFGLLIKQI
jgi:hypothetical protein